MLGGLIRRQELQAWRDRHQRLALAVLNDLAVDLIADHQAKVASLGAWQIAMRPNDYLAKNVDEPVRVVVQQIVDDLSGKASAELRDIIDRQFSWSQSMVSEVSQDKVELFGMGDLLSSVGPVAGGATVVASLPIVAVTTTASWFGLVTVTAISWPVVLVGSAVAGTAMATGGANALRLPDRLRAKLRQVIARRIAGIVVGRDRQAPSYLNHLVELLRKTELAAR